MIASRHERATEVFLAVVERSHDDRARALDTLCGRDAELRSEVESLLRHDAAAGGLDEPLRLERANRPEESGLGSSSRLPRNSDASTGQAITSATRPAPTSAQTATLGGYTILSLLGRGGMSSVYRARQHSPSREVALKVLDGGLGATEPRRLAIEARALARLSHPNIAAIYEAGIDRSHAQPRPYLAMELVEGPTITSWAQQRGLGLRERLALLASVCDGVHHAHQRGVVHRDIKPANILVGADGRPRVLDFGVARLMGANDDEPPATIAGVLLGTLAYMSPEQLAGATVEVDTRTDVYALGAVLFHLVAGSPPVDLSGLGLAEAAAKARATTPPRLRSVVPTCPTEVELIVAKALSTDPGARYSSPADLAADLRRYLHCQPILAAPPSAWYTLRTLARRRPGLVAAILVACLAIIGGVGAVWWQARIAESASRRAIAEAEAAAAVTRFIERTFAAVDARQEGSQAKVSDLLDSASVELTRDRAASAEVAARLHSLFGRAYLSLGMSGRAIDELRHAVAKFPDDESDQALDARQFLANALRSDRQFDEAEALASKVLADRSRLSGADHPSTLFAKASLAHGYSAQGQEALAEPLLREVLAKQTARLGPDHPAALHAVAALCRSLVRMGRWAVATPLLEDALARARTSLKTSHPTRVKLAWALAHAYSSGGSPEAAEAICVEHGAALEAYAISHPMGQRIRENWGRALRLQGRALEATDILVPAAAGADAGPEPSSEQAQDLRVECALALAAAGRRDDALAIAARVLACDHDAPRSPSSPAVTRARVLRDAGLIAGGALLPP